jgi:metallo-beta-lactamase class B
LSFLLSRRRASTSISVQVGGFARHDEKDITVTAGERRSVGTITLSVGSINDSVTVQAETTPVQTESAERSAALDRHEIGALLARGLNYNEPVRVFDNLYFLGTKVHESWAVTTSDGIILIDALFGYAAEAEITDGMKKLGLDPATIKYVIVSHGHGDHSGGAKYLQDTYHARIILSPADWDLLARDPNNETINPKRDMEATDGQKVTLGDTTLRLYITPGHTGGTISTLIPVKDGGKPHLAVEWGGTVIGPSSPVPMLQAYVKSAQRFRDLAVGGDVILTNHTAFDGTLLKNEALKNRKPNDPNPWIVGKATVERYLTVAEECGKANLIRAQAAAH